MASISASGNEITDAVRLAGVQGDGIAYPDSSYGIWEATTNLIRNGGFETNLTDWVTSGAATIVRDITDSKFGGACLNVTVFGAGDGVQGGGNQAGLVGKSISVATGLIYTASLWAKGVAGSSIRLSFEFNDATPTVSSTIVCDGTWQRIKVSQTPLSNTTADLLIKSPLFSGGSTSFKLDGIQTEQKPFATPYVHTDGATAARVASSISIPSSYIDDVQGWIATYFIVDAKPDGARAEPNGNCTLFSRADSTSRFMDLSIGGANDTTITFRRRLNAGLTYSVVAVGAAGYFAQGTAHMVVIAWTNTTMYLSIDNGAFVSVGSAPSGTVNNRFTIGKLDIGGLERWDNCRHKWVIGGTGVISQGNVATLSALGANDPTLSTLPASTVTTFAWGANTAVFSTFIDSAASALPSTSTMAGSPSVLYTGVGDYASTTNFNGAGSMQFNGNGVLAGNTAFAGSGVSTLDSGLQFLISDSAMYGPGTVWEAGAGDFASTSTFHGSGQMRLGRSKLVGADFQESELSGANNANSTQVIEAD